MKTDLTKNHPKDCEVIGNILNDAKIYRYEQVVITKLLDFVNRYVSMILNDSKICANHANREIINVNDIKLCSHFFYSNIPELSKIIAEESLKKNSIELPEIKYKEGLRIPSEKYCMTAKNIRMKSKRKEREIVQKLIPVSVKDGTSLRLIPNQNIITKVRVPNEPQKLIFKPKIKFTSAVSADSNKHKRKFDEI